MQNSAIPAKFPVPFANSAGSSYVRTVPQASQIGTQNGAASLTDGFPPNCFIPIAGGGSWPFGQDFNGLLKQVTSWDRWVQAGGPVIYDATFSSAIGGYPKGAVLTSADYTHTWLSTTDNNTTNPDTGGAGWIIPDVQSFNARTGAVTLSSADVTNALGFTPVQQGTGVGQGANAVKLGWSSSSRLKATVDATDLGNIATEAVSNHFTGANTFTTGAFSGAVTTAALTASGTIFASGARLRATFGATGSGDSMAATTLSDFAVSITNPGWTFLPNGLLVQFLRNQVSMTNSLGQAQYNWTFPHAYPNTVLGYCYTCGNEAAQYFTTSSFFGVSNSGMSILGSIPGGGAGLSCGFSGLIIGY